MRLNSYILSESSRAKEIEPEEAFELAKSKCSNAVKYYKKAGGNFIFRGTYNINVPYSFIDPKVLKRTSANTRNFYTLILDNDPRWREYPKRSRSMICSTNINKSRDYGSVYIVVPYDGFRIGVCPEDDIWDSFSYRLGNTTLGVLNRELFWLSEEFGVRLSEKSYPSFLDGVKSISDSLDDILEEDRDKFNWNGSSIIERWNWEGSFYKWYLGLFDPKKNDFFVAKDIGKVFSSGKRFKEIWTDSKSILVYYEDFKNFIKQL